MASDGAADVRRLHPATIIFRILSLFRALLIPVVGVFLFARGDRWEIWFGLLIIPALAFEVIRYIATRYRFEDDELIITFSFIFSNERHIPFARIQNIDLKQGVLHRLFNVAEVSIETGSGGKAEANLRVVSLDRVEELRSRIFAERAPKDAPTGSADGTDIPIDGVTTPIEKTGETLIRITPGEIVRIGLIANRGLVLVAGLIGLSWEFDLWDRFGGLADQIRTWVEDQWTAPGLPLIIGGLAALIVLYILSIAWSFLRFWGFTLVRYGDDLRLTTGLLTRHAATIPRRRIQLISIRRTPLHRVFKRSAIRVETAGGVGEGDEEQVFSRKHFVPIVPADRAEELVREIHPDFALADIDWQPLAPKAARRMMRLQGFFGLIAGGLVGWWIGWPLGAIVGPAILAIAIWHARASVRCTSWGLTKRGVVVRTGVIAKRLTITLFAKVQTAEVVENIFDRRWKMASFRVDTAGAGPAGHRIELRYLARDAAATLRQAISANAERTGFRWS